MPEAIAPQVLPRDFRIIWVSTRKAGPAADGLAANIAGCYLLHELLASVKLPLDELSSAHLVAVEIPPVALEGFEHDLFHLVAKIPLDHMLLSSCSQVFDDRLNKHCGFTGGTNSTIDLSNSSRHALVSWATSVRDVTFRS